MSPREMAWRAASALRDRVDRFLLGQRQRERPMTAILDGPVEAAPGFPVCPVRAQGGQGGASRGRIDGSGTRVLLERAEKIARHQLSFFDLRDQDLGNPILWNRDHKRRQDTPLVFSPALDYRDVGEAGDCKFVWEPNRHHQLVVLGRAYRVSGDRRFAQAVAEQLEGWLQQNPFGVGMNWRSGLELGVRLINWVWALDLIRPSKAISPELDGRLLDCVARHIWEIDRKYSRGSSVGNHLIGEAAGVFVAASYFRNLRHATRWRQRSWEILNREILNQTYPDGCPRELSTGYHLFILQFLTIAAVVTRATGGKCPPAYESRLEKMFEFLAVLREGGGTIAAFGDGDDGYVLDLSEDPHSMVEWLAVGATLFGRSDFKAHGGGRGEVVEALLGLAGWERFTSLGDHPRQVISSKALKHGGYYLLQHGRADAPDRISVVFDCGPLGLEPMAGHGHADALSFTLRVFGRDVLVDPGTYDYFSYPAWRRYFRSTRAHNTVVVDGRDQSEMLGSFLWGRKARARCLTWQPTPTGGIVAGEHDGYAVLPDPVVHRRTLELDGQDRTLVIRDEIVARGQHEIKVFFHWAEHCLVRPAGVGRFLVDAGPGTVRIEIDPQLQVELFQGSVDPICGWVSRGYHQKQASTTLVGRCLCRGSASLTCRMYLGQTAPASPREEDTPGVQRTVPAPGHRPGPS